MHRFWTSSWGKVPWVLWQTFQPQSQSLVFLSLELEFTVVALLTTLTYDQLTQSVIYLQDTDITPDFLQLEREGPVYQFDSAVQETMKLLMLMGNAMVDIHLFISLERLITSSYCSLTSHDWSLAGSPISTDLEISNKTQSLTVVMIKLALTAKFYVSS